MWTTMKNNFLWIQLLNFSSYLYRFCKYISYGFPIINFCNPGVHYETPCTTVGAVRWLTFIRNMVTLFMFAYSQILWLNTVMYKLGVLITVLLFSLVSVVYSYLCIVTGWINLIKFKTCYFFMLSFVTRSRLGWQKTGKQLPHFGRLRVV
jgi:hypothetical protein